MQKRSAHMKVFISIQLGFIGVILLFILAVLCEKQGDNSYGGVCQPKPGPQPPKPNGPIKP